MKEQISGEDFYKIWRKIEISIEFVKNTVKKGVVHRIPAKIPEKIKISFPEIQETPEIHLKLSSAYSPIQWFACVHVLIHRV